MGSEELPWTGERLVPSVRGDVALEHLHRYAMAAELVGGRDILDIASGEGYGSHLLAMRARTVVGVDISSEAVSHARVKYSRPNLSFHEGSCMAIPLPDASVDVVVSFETIEHIQEHEQFLAEILRVLRKGGQLLISTPDRTNYDATLATANPFHKRELSCTEFEALLRGHFAHVHLLGQRVTHASVVLGIDASAPQTCGMFTGNFRAVEFSGKLPLPTYLLALCGDAPLPAVPVGNFVFKDQIPDSVRQSEGCSVQVFADQGDGYSETVSASKPFVEDIWQTIEFKHLECLHTDCRNRLRIDLVNQPAFVEVTGIRITRDADKSVLYDATSAAEFRGLEHSPNVLTHFEGEKLVVLAMDADPQFYLPPLPDFQDATCTLELTVRWRNTVPCALHRVHELAGSNQMLAELTESMKLRNARLETSEDALKHLLAESHVTLDSTQSRLESLMQDLAAARAQLAERQQAIESAHVEMEERQQALESVRGELAEHQRNLESARGEIAEHKRNLESVRGEIAEHKQELESVRGELRGLTSSLLWRLAAPLRRIGMFASRLKRSVGKRLAELREIFARIAVRLPWNRDLRRLGRDRKLIRQSRLMDARWYFNRYPDARHGKPDPVLHYLRYGALKGYAPSPLFDTRWYLEQNPDVANAGTNPLVHYLRIGAAEGRDPNPLFDSDWYLSQYPDVSAAGCNPLSHYVNRGWTEARTPGPHFDAKLYEELNPDVAAARTNPLVHYLRFGRHEERRLHPPIQPPIPRCEMHEAVTPFSKDPEDFSGWPEPDVRLLAFYLPQFHRIPENDLWWGDGFTEWANVRRALPQASWHYQPHVPHSDIGYYDLMDPEVVERQANMARKFGVHGFCFYHYWFAGKRLLEMPVQRLLATGKPDFPFCLCWANENWTRRWDGMDFEILIAQEYSMEDDVAFIRDIIPAMRDRRYIRTGGRPLLLVYRPLFMPDPPATFRHWRDVCREEGIGEIHLAGVLGANFKDPHQVGLDSAVEFPPNSIAFRPIEDVAGLLNPDFRGVYCDYYQASADSMAGTASEFQVFRTAMPSWDNSARRGDCGSIYGGSNPSHYFNWLRFIVEQTRASRKGDERIAFVNAWNEWAEGCHLEPDTKYGYAWLNATRRALVPSGVHSAAPILIIGHDAQRAGSQNVLLCLLREWKRVRPFSFWLILNESGPLRGEFEACCPTLVLSDYPHPGKRKAALDTFLITRPRLLFSNTVVNGPLLKELHRFGVPAITHVHELQKSIERWAPGPIFAATLEHSDHFIAVSPPVAANLRERHRVAPESITVVHAFIDTEYPLADAEGLTQLRTELGAVPEDILVFGCGTADWRKGPDLFVKIAAECRSEPRLRFAWIGGASADEQAALDIEIERHGLCGRVRFLGQQSDPRRFFAAGQIFLLSSREDPFPLVALEAADVGLPVVCFADAGGMPDFVGTECGAVVPFADTSAAAAAIRRLASDEALRARLGSQAREKVRREHSTHAAAARIATLVAEIASGKTSAESPPDARPLVSVIVPNYNHAPFLAKRLESIAAQGIENMEILILDDASTDESREILNAFASMHPRTRLVLNAANSGSTFKQWRKGLDMARGQFVWIAESDDCAEPGLLSALLHKLQRNPDAAIAYAQSRMIDESDRDLGLPLEWTADLSTTRWLSDFVANGHEEIRTALSIKNSIPNASAVVFRNFDGIVDLVDDTMRLCADWLFWVRLCARGGVAFDARPLNRWRQRTSNARTRPPGELEWLEGAQVVTECAEALAASPYEREELLSAFRARCEGWRTNAVPVS